MSTAQGKKMTSKSPRYVRRATVSLTLEEEAVADRVLASHPGHRLLAGLLRDLLFREAARLGIVQVPAQTAAAD